MEKNITKNDLTMNEQKIKTLIKTTLIKQINNIQNKSDMNDFDKGLVKGYENVLWLIDNS